MEINYKIIAADGAEYGPVGLDELKHWIVDGRVAEVALDGEFLTRVLRVVDEHVDIARQ